MDELKSVLQRKNDFHGSFGFFPTPLSTLAINTSIKKGRRKKQNNMKHIPLLKYIFSVLLMTSMDRSYFFSVSHLRMGEVIQITDNADYKIFF